MTITMPYFMENKEWYYYDEEEYCWKLTDKAPPEAVKSYEEYYETVNSFITFDDFDEKKKETFQEYLKSHSFLEATKLYEAKGGTVYLVEVKGAKEENLYVSGGCHVLVFTDGTWRIFTEWKEYEQQLDNH